MSVNLLLTYSCAFMTEVPKHVERFVENKEVQNKFYEAAYGRSVPGKNSGLLIVNSWFSIHHNLEVSKVLVQQETSECKINMSIYIRKYLQFWYLKQQKRRKKLIFFLPIQVIGARIHSARFCQKYVTQKVRTTIICWCHYALNFKQGKEDFGEMTLTGQTGGLNQCLLKARIILELKALLFICCNRYWILVWYIYIDIKISKMTSGEMREVLSSFMEHCPDCFTMYMYSYAIIVWMSVCLIAFQFYQQFNDDILTEEVFTGPSNVLAY